MEEREKQKPSSKPSDSALKKAQSRSDEPLNAASASNSTSRPIALQPHQNRPAFIPADAAFASRATRAPKRGKGPAKRTPLRQSLVIESSSPSPAKPFLKNTLLNSDVSPQQSFSAASPAFKGLADNPVNNDPVLSPSSSSKPSPFLAPAALAAPTSTPSAAPKSSSKLSVPKYRQTALQFIPIKNVQQEVGPSNPNSATTSPTKRHIHTEPEPPQQLKRPNILERPEPRKLSGPEPQSSSSYRYIDLEGPLLNISSSDQPAASLSESVGQVIEPQASQSGSSQASASSEVVKFFSQFDPLSVGNQPLPKQTSGVIGGDRVMDVAMEDGNGNRSGHGRNEVLLPSVARDTVAPLGEDSGSGGKPAFDSDPASTRLVNPRSSRFSDPPPTNFEARITSRRQHRLDPTALARYHTLQCERFVFRKTLDLAGRYKARYHTPAGQQANSNPANVDDSLASLGNDQMQRGLKFEGKIVARLQKLAELDNLRFHFVDLTGTAPEGTLARIFDKVLNVWEAASARSDSSEQTIWFYQASIKLTLASYPVIRDKFELEFGTMKPDFIVVTVRRPEETEEGEKPVAEWVVVDAKSSSHGGL